MLEDDASTDEGTSEEVLVPCIVDSGETSHLIPSAFSHLLHHSREPLGVCVKDASGNSMRVVAIGSVHLKLVCGRKVTLKDVLAVEGLQRVIVSLSSADKDGWTSRQANGASQTQAYCITRNHDAQIFTKQWCCRQGEQRHT